MRIAGCFLLLLLITGCYKQNTKSLVQKDISFAVHQIENQLKEIQKSGQLLNPKTISPNGETVYIPFTEWTSGFFPGQLWLLYELTGDTVWKSRARQYTETLDSVKYITDDHDVGFMIGCSYGNGLRLDKVNYIHYKDVIIQAAKSLCTRYNPQIGSLQSWDVRGWIIPKGWKYPVIIDNLMNLEILFESTRLSNDSSFYKIAISHAETTLKNHFRQDNSCYHVVDYDPETGAVLHKHTAQGYSHESVWSRGQAWAVYGYTMLYRYTGNERYLEQADKVAQMLLNHPNMPIDLVPAWDLDAPEEERQLRDVSSASILVSAFYELSTYKGKYYKDVADKILASLSSAPYLAEPGGNNNFILQHSVGSIPHGNEIDVPLNYADYYFLEALVRKQKLENN